MVTGAEGGITNRTPGNREHSPDTCAPIKKMPVSAANKKTAKSFEFRRFPAAPLGLGDGLFSYGFSGTIAMLLRRLFLGAFLQSS
jgi:hypothetical protein